MTAPSLSAVEGGALGAEPVLGELEIRALCGRLLCGCGEVGDEELLASEPELAVEVARRMEASGAELVRRGGAAPTCVVRESAGELPEPALACLALCVLALGERRSSGPRSRVSVKAIWERVGEPRGVGEAYLRRAGLGPLEARGLVRVVKPGQRAGDAYVVAGPALSAIDADAIRRRLAARGGGS